MPIRGFVDTLALRIDLSGNPSFQELLRRIKTITREDGCMEHLGRKDFQVKIRGYRVVLTEIEAALYCLEMINEAVVTTHRHESGETYLVAYIVPSRLPAPTVDELRRTLADTLPDYMIPTRFVLLERFPLTPTGKVDRQALPESGHTRPEMETAFASPRNHEEETLTHIWAEVLEIDQVGIPDFFRAKAASVYDTFGVCLPGCLAIRSQW